MRYYVPELAVLPDKEGLASMLTGLFSKSKHPSPTAERLGGVPFGLPPSAWPKCTECGKYQSLLAQLAHHPDRLDLGRQGRMLLVFQCNHDPGMCATWDAFSGANACIVIEPEDIKDGPTPAPDDNLPNDHGVLITGWWARDDSISESELGAYFDETTYFERYEALNRTVTYSTRLGGVPRWIQSPNEAPKPDWRFLGQLDGTYSFLTPPKYSRPWISPDPENFEGRTHIGEGPNLGGGLAYLFMRENASRPDVVMFWQCG